MKKFNEWIKGVKNEYFSFDNSDDDSRDNKYKSNLDNVNFDDMKRNVSAAAKRKHVIEVLNSPTLTIRKCPKTDDPEAAVVLSNYARGKKVGLIDPKMSRLYLSMSDIYFIKTPRETYFVSENGMNGKILIVDSETDQPIDPSEFIVKLLKSLWLKNFSKIKTFNILNFSKNLKI